MMNRRVYAYIREQNLSKEEVKIKYYPENQNVATDQVSKSTPTNKSTMTDQQYNGEDFEEKKEEKKRVENLKVSSKCFIYKP